MGVLSGLQPEGVFRFFEEKLKVFHLPEHYHIYAENIPLYIRMFMLRNVNHLGEAQDFHRNPLG